MNRQLRLATLCLSSAAGVALAIYVARASTPEAGGAAMRADATLAAAAEPSATAAAEGIEGPAGGATDGDAGAPALAEPREPLAGDASGPADGVGTTADETSGARAAPPWEPAGTPADTARSARTAPLSEFSSTTTAAEPSTLRLVPERRSAELTAIARLEPPAGARPPVSRMAAADGPAQAVPQPPARQPVQQPAPQPGPQVLPPPAGPHDVGEGDNDLLFKSKNADIREVLTLLSKQAGLNIVASNAVQGKVSVSFNVEDVDAETALGAILRSTGLMARREGQFLYVSTPAEFAARDQLYDPIGIRVYRPNYTTATELSNLLTPFITPSVGKISVTSRAKAGLQASDNEAGGDDLACSDVVVVQDHESVLRKVDQVFREVDCRPMQVAIEAMILSVDLDDDNKLGVDFSYLAHSGNVKFTLGSPVTDLANISVENGGLKFAFLDGNTGAFIEALETIGDTNVIATPRLLALNKQRAEILIGAQLGYVNTTVTETTATQSVEFLEVGTQLRLRPFISRDGLIRMEVHPELSTGKVTVEDGLTLPDKQVTKVTTNIMVRDGCTMIIGGLMREDLITTGKQIPWLGSLPVVGPIFRHLDEQTQRREILVLVTPHIVYDEQGCCEGDRAAAEFHRRQAIYADNMSPLGKRYMGRRQFHLAQEAWAAGDRQRALHHADLAIHYDPLNRAAIDLRSDIVAGVPYGDHTLYGAPAPAAGAMYSDGGILTEPTPVVPYPGYEQPATPLPPGGSGSPGSIGPQPRPGRVP